MWKLILSTVYKCLLTNRDYMKIWMSSDYRYKPLTIYFSNIFQQYISVIIYFSNRTKPRNDWVTDSIIYTIITIKERIVCMCVREYGRKYHMLSLI